ncbi:sensor histidine kinase [Pustulibacterium marinum]|nr:HAMP domain-containing sensor histidine kinase [Pustulibacterium marinum]
MSVVFAGIYLVVKKSLYQHIDSDLFYESKLHLAEIAVDHHQIVFTDKEEWEEREHVELQVNPVFVQITDSLGNTLDKSPNLKNGNLKLHVNQENNSAFNTKLNGTFIRQIQTPIHEKNVVKGYIITAMSVENITEILDDLLFNLLLFFPFILILIFVSSRILAGGAIKPVQKITNTANLITKENLNQRITLPKNKDELFLVTKSINDLLDRIEEALQREKQFTSDASHQLRTPLAVLKGTLEVLIRKERNCKEYETKITSSIQEIDRISDIVDQLLLLARFNKNEQLINKENFATTTLIDDIIQRFRKQISEKNIAVYIKDDHCQELFTSKYYLELILENLLSNAIKYSPINSKITIKLSQENNKPYIYIEDQGIGIAKDEFDKIYNPFYRINPSDRKIKGNGLGLSIVKKASEMIHAPITMHSEEGKGTTFKITID